MPYVDGYDAKPGKRTSFPQSVKLKAGETVILSMPFDGRRMFWGGLRVLVDL